MKIDFSLPIVSALLFCFSSCNNSDTGKASLTESQQAPEVKSIFINGDSIHYIDIGKGDPVVFVHGTLGDFRTWGGQVDTFAKNHRVIAYSRRFAYPNKQVINDSADYTVIPHAKDLAEFIKALKLEPVHLVGHSYGAFTALLTTKDHPELVRSLMLGEPPVMSLLENVPGGDSIFNDFIVKGFRPTAEAFKNNENEKAVKTFVSGVIGDTSAYSKIPEPGRAMMMQNTLELRGSALTKNLFPPLKCADFGKIQTPVLLMKADRSPLFFSLIINELDRCLTNKEVVVLKNSSHGLEFDNPADFNRIVLGFIDKH
jgi:pimeloyl-ACP methyl ester carboxylesterase